MNAKSPHQTPRRAPTNLQVAVDTLVRQHLGRSLDAVLARERGNGQSYEDIARTLCQVPGVRINQSTVRRWCRALDEEPEAVAS